MYIFRSINTNILKVSIITVVYNNEFTIADAIESVLSQDYNDIEYIIVDGNSTDRTLSIVNQYRDRITKIISEKDNGIYDAMNKGIHSATGDIIGILNSDDLYNDRYVISNVVETFYDKPDIGAIYGDLYYVDAKNPQKIVRHWVSKLYYNNFFEDGEVPPHPTFFIKRTIYDEVKVFDLTYKLAADYDLMFRILKVNSIKSYHVNRVLVRMRLGGATNKNLKNIFRGNKEIINIWSKYNYKIPVKFFINRYAKKIYQHFR